MRLRYFPVVFLVSVVALLTLTLHGNGVLGSGADPSGAAVLDDSTVIDLGATTISGEVALRPGDSTTGEATSNLAEAYEPTNVSASRDHADLSNALTGSAGLASKPMSKPITTSASANLTGLTLAPGVPMIPIETTNLAGALTLDGDGNANAAWVFPTASSFISSPDSSEIVENTGADASAYWNVPSLATFGTDTPFGGNTSASPGNAPYSGATGGSGSALDSGCGGACGNGSNSTIGTGTGGDALPPPIDTSSAGATLGCDSVLDSACDVASGNDPNSISGTGTGGDVLAAPPIGTPNAGSTTGCASILDSACGVTNGNTTNSIAATGTEGGSTNISSGGSTASPTVAVTNFSSESTPVPEPGTLNLLLPGLLAIGLLALRKSLSSPAN